MKKLVWVVIGAVLFAGAWYWARSVRESTLRAVRVEAEVEQARDLPKGSVKINTLQAGEGQQVFPFEAKVVELMAPAGLEGVSRCDAPCDAELDMHVTVDVRAGRYIDEGSGEISTRYTGAKLSGTLELRLSSGGTFIRSFAADKPLQTVIRGGFRTPSEAPLFEIFWEHVVPRIADLLGEAFGPDLLIRALRTGDDEPIRVVHADALVRMGPTAVEPLVKTLASRHPRVRIAAASALGDIGAQAAVEYLMGFLNVDDEEFRFAVACALTKLGAPRGIEALTPFLRHGDRSFRRPAVVALARSPHDLAIDGLISALDQTDLAAALATAALKQRTGVDFGRDQQQWRNWRRVH